MKTLAFLAAWAVGTAQAADFRALVKAGIDVGGDTLVTAVFSDGETEAIKANDGFYIGGGAAIIDAERNMEYHLSLAYKVAVVEASNGDIEWTRFALEALAFYRFPRVRVGGGLAYHISPRVEVSGVPGGMDVKFKNALGAVLQADWRITDKIAAGLRYTILEYDAKGAFTGSAKSNGFGLTFSMNF